MFFVQRATLSDIPRSTAAAHGPFTGPRELPGIAGSAEIEMVGLRKNQLGT